MQQYAAICSIGSLHVASFRALSLFRFVECNRDLSAIKWVFQPVSTATNGNGRSQDLAFVADTRSLAILRGSTLRHLENGHDGHDGYDGHDGHDGHGHASLLPAWPC